MSQRRVAGRYTSQGSADPLGLDKAAGAIPYAHVPERVFVDEVSGSLAEPIKQVVPSQALWRGHAEGRGTTSSVELRSVYQDLKHAAWVAVSHPASTCYGRVVPRTCTHETTPALLELHSCDAGALRIDL